MGNKRVLIRVDGDSVIGMGHIYRCIALAEILKSDFDIVFVSNFNSNCQPVINSSFQVNFIPELISIPEEYSWLIDNYDKSDFVVLDGYQFDNIYQNQLRSEGFKLFYVDDLVEEKPVADVLINHCPGITESDYIKSKYTKFALGLKYALLRKSFLDFNRNSRRRVSSIKNVLVSFGGSNPGEFSLKSVLKLLELNDVREIHVLGGSSEDFLRLSTGDTCLRIHSGLNEKEVIQLMKSVDLAIVPSSTISLELASLGIPMILGYFIENQTHIYEGLKNLNSVYGVGDYNSFNFNQLSEIFKKINNLEFLGADDLVSLFDNSSSTNLLNLFKYESLVLRDASLEDLNFVFELANDKVIRENSYNSKRIEIEQHTIWFNNQLKSKTRAFFIVVYNGRSIGQVRFSFESDHSIIGISIEENSRGKKLGSEILRRAVDKYGKSHQLPIYAYIKKSNIFSVKSFENAGFEFYRNEMVSGVDSFLYKKEIN